jgi:hypothetical protein
MARGNHQKYIFDVSSCGFTLFRQALCFERFLSQEGSSIERISQ